jgi:hypothetical protein
MLGNVWEWVQGGKPEARILRGGSFLDSADGSFNHAVMVSTRQLNSGDSGASNIGFRCAGPPVQKNKQEAGSSTSFSESAKSQGAKKFSSGHEDIIEL